MFVTIPIDTVLFPKPQPFELAREGWVPVLWGEMPKPEFPGFEVLDHLTLSSLITWRSESAYVLVSSGPNGVESKFDGCIARVPGFEMFDRMEVVLDFVQNVQLIDWRKPEGVCNYAFAKSQGNLFDEIPGN